MARRKKQPRSRKNIEKKIQREKRIEEAFMATRKWKIKGGKEVDGKSLLIIKCPNDHFWIHVLREYPHHDCIFAKCPECGLRRLLIGILDEMEKEGDKI